MKKTKTFDCVTMKNKLQEKLYNSINQKNTDDYLKKLKVSINNSEWIKDIKKKKASNKNK